MRLASGAAIESKEGETGSGTAPRDGSMPRLPLGPSASVVSTQSGFAAAAGHRPGDVGAGAGEDAVQERAEAWLRSRGLIAGGDMG